MAARMLLGRPVRGWLVQAPAIAGRVLAVALIAFTLLVASTPRAASAETAGGAPTDPYAMIVMLQIRMPRGEVTCTGFMVGPHTVATAAHCLFNHDMGGWASSAFVTPGLDGVKAPFATVWATSFNVNPTWIETQDLRADYASITLASDSVGAATGWFELASPSDFQLATGTYETAGYGTSAQYGTLWRMPAPEPLVSYDEDFLAYVWGTSTGESGAPIFHRGGDNRYQAVGLLKGAFGRTNQRVEFALRLDTEIIDFYRQQTAAPTAAPVVQSIPTMFTAPAGSTIQVTSPSTRPDVDSVLQSSADQTRWTTVASARTNEQGVATYEIAPTETLYYRVVVRGVGTGRVGQGFVTTVGAGSGKRGTFAAPPTFAASSRVAFAVFQGGTTDQLDAAIAAVGARAAWVQDAQGTWRLYLPGGGTLNDGFLQAFPGGFPGATSVTLVGP